MASIYDILNNTDPEQLKKVLTENSSSQAMPVQVVAPAPKPDEDASFSMFGSPGDKLVGGVAPMPAIAQASGPSTDPVPLNIPGITDVPADKSAQDDSDEEEEDSPSPTPKASADPEKSRIQAMLDKVSGKTPVSQAMNTSDAISALLGKNNKELSEAKEARDRMQLIAMLGHAGQTAGAALVPMSGIKPDEKFTQDLLATAQQPVSDVEQKQKIQGQLLKDQSLKEQLSNEMAKQDPNSEISAFYRDLVRGEAARAKMDNIKIPDTASASNLEKMLPGLSHSADRQVMADGHKLQADANQIAKQDKADAKLLSEQAKAYSEAQQKVSSFRGNAGLQQASKDVLNTNKALALINQPGMKTTQDLRLLAEEMGKVASGGVPGEHGVEALMPSNLKTRYAELVNFIASKPTDTQANEYIQRNKAYLNEIGKVAGGAINKYQMNLAKSFKGRLKSEDYKELVDGINGQFQDFGEKKESSKPGPGSIVQIKGKTYKVGTDGDSLEEVK